MFIPIPIRFRDGREFHTIPVVNGLLVAMNVLFFFFGWQPHVGWGTGPLSTLTYAFGHINVWHLAGNMLALLVFGTPVNRRVGNGWYLIGYLGSAFLLGVLARMFCSGGLIGASGAVFSVVAAALLLLPSARIEIFYFALFPMTVPLGLIWRPLHWVFWFIRWDSFEMRAWWGIFLVPFLEVWSLFWGGLNWTNVGHLLGLACGIAWVLLLPTRITMRGQSHPVFSGVE